MEPTTPDKGREADGRDQALARMQTAAEAGPGQRDRLRAEAEQSRREKRLRPEPGRRRGRGLWIRLIIVLALAAVILALLLLLAPKISDSLRIDVDIPTSFAELLPDEEMGYNKIQFQEAILGETREKSDLVVLEQDVQVTTEISQALANIALFEKTQTLVSYGTGVYAVNLSDVGAQQISLDEAARIVTVSIPHAALSYISFDVSRTESGQTKRAIFGFGDIKLTTEQMTILETGIEEAMREKLDAPEALTAADERALILVRELLDPLVKSVAPEFSVKVVMGSAE